MERANGNQLTVTYTLIIDEGTAELYWIAGSDEYTIANDNSEDTKEYTISSGDNYIVLKGQLIQKLIYAILSNELSSGDSIPSVREMAEILHINPNTVLKSYKAVKQEHLIICSKGGKYSVTQDYDCIQQVKQNTIKELCCSYLSKMFALGFSKSEAIEQLQNYCDKLSCHQ